MKEQDYQNTITANLSGQEVIEKISQVSKWWAKQFGGKSQEVGDVFTVRFSSGDTYTIKVSEVIPEKTIVWDVIESYQGWNSHHTEWNGTKIIWEIGSKNNKTDVKMTHFGLVPECECFDACSRGWNYLLEKSLQKLLDEDNGMPV